MAKKSARARKKAAPRARGTERSTVRKKSKSAKTRAGSSRAAVPPATPATLDDALDAIRNFASAQAASGKATGACLIANPLGGRMCVSVDRETCKALKGTFVGGQCL